MVGPEIAFNNTMKTGKFPYALQTASPLNHHSSCPCRSAFVRQCLLGVWLLLLMGCAPKSRFEGLRLQEAPEQYRSSLWTRESIVRMEKVGAGLRCVVEADQRSEAKPYGGIMLRTPKAKGWRVEMAFTEKEDILYVFVDGYNKAKKRVLRWQTAGGAKLRSEKTVYLFTPEQAVEGFKAVASDGTGPVETLHVFVRVKPGSRACFDLYRVELAK